MPLTNHSIPRMLAWAFTDDEVTRPSAWYLAAHTADPTAAGNVGEVSGNGYARVAVALTIEGNIADNDAALEFPVAVGGGHGTISHAAVWDAPTGGNCWIRGPLAAPKVIAEGDALRILAGELDLTLV